MRVAIVDDLALARETLQRVVLQSPGAQIAWTAEDGETAVKKAIADRPDVILMDLVMPKMDGVEATRRIMSASPCPILLVTSSVTGNFNRVFEAMSAGALDAVDKPVYGPGGVLLDGDMLLRKIEKATRLRSSMGAAGQILPGGPMAEPSTTMKVVLLGASTGGPDALAMVLGSLPKGFRAAVVIAQHLDAAFIPRFVTWLQERTALRVKSAVPGERLDGGTAYVACSNDHLIIDSNRRPKYVAEPVDYPYRPSADMLFSSFAVHWRPPGVAALLTGMGTDGAKGLLQLRAAGWSTIAQDEATSVLYGMPKEAAAIRAAQKVLPIGEIATILRAIVGH